MNFFKKMENSAVTKAGQWLPGYRLGEKEGMDYQGTQVLFLVKFIMLTVVTALCDYIHVRTQ